MTTPPVSSFAIPWLWVGVVILFLLLIALVVYLVWRGREAAKPKTAQNPEMAEPETISSALATELPDSFNGALSTLRSRVPGRDFRYTLPWFLMLGTPGSGKTSLLGESNMTNFLEEQVRLEQDAGLDWNFFDNAVVIDVGGWAFSNAADAVRTWRRLLRLFLNNRPERPLDGIVLTLPASDLIGPAALSQAALVERGAALQQRLRQMALTLSFQLPIYVVLTKCDMIPGFSSYVAELEAEDLQQIFGWSNPHGEATQFRAEWVDEAIDSMRVSLERRQSALFALHEPKADRGNMFLFPGVLYSMIPNLRHLLVRALRGGDHAPSPILRGIYCSGSAREHVPGGTGAGKLIPVSVPVRHHNAPAPFESSLSWVPSLLEPWLHSDLQIAFTQDLFLKKIFLERGLAIPLAQHFASRDRLRLRLQIASGVTAAVLAIGTAVAYHSLHVTQQNLTPLLDTINQDLSARASNASGHIAPERRPDAATLIETMAGFQTDGFYSAFIPVSWFSHVDRSVREAMVPALQVLVLQRFYEGLLNRIDAIATAQPAAATSERPSSPILRLDALPEYQRMRSFLLQINDLQRHVGVYNQLSSRQSPPSVSSIVELDQYLHPKRRDAPFNDISNPYFDQALRDARWTPLLVTSEMQASISDRARQLSTALFEAWIRQNPTRTLTDQLAGQLNTLALPSRHSFQELLDTRSAFAAATRAYGDPSLSWTGSKEFEMPPGLAVVTTSGVGSPQFFQTTLSSDMTATAKTDFDDLTAALDGAETPLTGPLLKLENDQLALSDQAQEVQLALENLLGLSFMSPGSSDQNTTRNERYFTWNKASLEAATVMPGVYKRYLSEDLGNAPASLRSAFSRIAAEQLSQTLVRAIDESMQPAQPPASGTTGPIQQTQDFANVSATLSAFLATLDQYGLQTPLAQLRQASVRQASNLLTAFDGALNKQTPYGVSTAAFGNWTVEDKPSADIFGAPTADALAAYVAAQRTDVESLGTAAAPVVEFLTTNRASLPAQTVTMLTRWQGITGALDQYKAKRPGNSIQTLEDFISTGVDKITPATGCDAAHANRVPARTPDYFTQENAQLYHNVVLRCQVLATESFQRTYTALATRFNHDLANRFPFAPLSASAIYEADPQLVAGMLTQRDAAGNILTRNTAEGSLDVSIFLSEVQNSRPWFASMLSTATASEPPSLDFVPAFRVNRDKEIAGNQIIEWTLRSGSDIIHATDPERKIHWSLGDPITLSFRWAKDSPFIPVPTTDPHTGYDVLVSSDTVSYTFKDSWSLIRLVRTFLPVNASTVDPDSTNAFTLAFSIPEVPASAVSAKLQTTPVERALVFIRLQIAAPGEKSIIHDDAFPVAAPALVPPIQAGK